ncbi:hypothetical protein EZS27_016269 [termite gut metagenome]|uniref:Uncharacterized protein n=1 Tax=termite gut metagenome TaxID=433724 RepID=A0A5J4RNA6_9ZZZZ
MLKIFDIVYVKIFLIYYLLVNIILFFYFFVNIFSFFLFFLFILLSLYKLMIFVNNEPSFIYNEANASIYEICIYSIIIYYPLL